MAGLLQLYDNCNNCYFSVPERFQCSFLPVSGREKATRLPPAGRPDFAPPAEITRNCRPFTMYVLGVALPPNGSSACQTMAPVSLSNARIVSSAVAPIKTRP